MKRFFGHQTLKGENDRIGDIQSDESEDSASEDVDQVQQIPSLSPISSVASLNSSLQASHSSREATLAYNTKQMKSKHQYGSQSSSNTSKKWYVDSDDEKEQSSQTSSSCDPKIASETNDSNHSTHSQNTNSKVFQECKKDSDSESPIHTSVLRRSTTRETKSRTRVQRHWSETSNSAEISGKERAFLQENETAREVEASESILQRKAFRTIMEKDNVDSSAAKPQALARHVVKTWQNSALTPTAHAGSPKASFGRILKITRQDETLSARAGNSESGVVLEGWLRQKQRRGVKGLKKWNARYYIVYATNEVRYYADMVASAWGVIPLQEIGSISARLMQNVEKLSHPKYKGCRFDITCRNGWVTHYADDYVSPDGASILPGINPKGVGIAKGDKTKSSTRVYSLIADSPQTASLWASTLNSLMTQNQFSPKAEVRRNKSNQVKHEIPADDNVPWLVKYAVDYIYKSTPGIETPLFYEQKADTNKLEICLRFLEVPNEEKPKNTQEIDQIFDVVIAGAVINMWLEKMDQPIVPFVLYKEFEVISMKAEDNPIDSIRDLKTLRRKLPARNLASLACLLFHLNDVSAYASQNKMDASYLANVFTNFIVRPQEPIRTNSTEAIHWLLSDMITHIDDYIDEEEASGLP